VAEPYLVGAWDGPAGEAPDVSAAIRGDRMTLWQGKKEIATGGLRLDARSGHLELVQQYRTWEGIYRLDAGALTICWSTSVQPRPKDFAATRGLELIVLKRRR
jgi:uncharacterized protein (TIGR03067 family)